MIPTFVSGFQPPGLLVFSSATEGEEAHRCVLMIAVDDLRPMLHYGFMQQPGIP